jgi:hypothetical protein
MVRMPTAVVALEAYSATAIHTGNISMLDAMAKRRMYIDFVELCCYYYYYYHYIARMKMPSIDETFWLWMNSGNETKQTFWRPD